MRQALLLTALLVATSAHAQWEIQPVPTTADLRGIHALGNGVAWASGTAGTILRTTDDGKTWQRCATPPDAGQLDFRGVQAFDASTAIVMSSGKGALSRLYKTTDECKTWTLLFTNPDSDGFWDAVQFADSKHGYLLGDPVHDVFRFWRTDDSGSTWHEDYSPFRVSSASQAIFAASNSALWVSTAPSNPVIPYLAFGSGGGTDAMVYILSWHKNATGYGGGRSRYDLPLGRKTETSGVFSLCFHDEDNGIVGIAVGGDYLKPKDDLGTAAETRDGANWHPAQTPPHGYRSAVAYDAAIKTWITVGPNGTDISTDDGRNWRALKPGASEPPDADQHWNALSLPFVVGPHGRIGKLRVEALHGPAR